MTNLTVTDSFRSLEAEVRQLRELVQIQARHNEVIEAQMAKLKETYSIESDVVTICDDIPPLVDSVCLTSTGDGAAPYQWVDPPCASETIPTGNDWWPTKRKICNYLVPNSGWQNHSIQATTSLVIAFSMFGLDRTEIEECVDRIRQQQAVSANFVPIFITDSTCFDVFRRYGFVFEYFPSAERRRMYNGSMDWGTYASKRLDLVIKKWGIAKMIVFGKRTILTDTPADFDHDRKATSLPAGLGRNSPPMELENGAEAESGKAAASRSATVAANGARSEPRAIQQAIPQPRLDASPGRPTGEANGSVEAGHSVKGAAEATRWQVVFFPDYRHANPYQTLLYGTLPSHVKCEAGTIHDALDRQAAGGLGTRTIFHLHWEDAVIKNEPSEAAAKAAAKAFIAALQLFLSRGGAVIWTVHNVASHDGVYPGVQEALCRDLSKIARCVHFHSDSAYRIASKRFGPPEDRVRIVPHGNYVDLIDTTEQRDTIRESLGYRPDDRVFILFGRIMRYKGADDLLRAFSSLKATNAKLIIAGKILDPLSIEDLPNECRAQIAVHEGRLAQADLSRLVRAADFAVLPYRRVLTSGSVLFAMSAGVPVIVPNLPSLIEMVGPEQEGLLFEPGSPKDLATKLREAASMNESQRRALSSNALEAAKKYDWGKLGDAYATLLLQPVEEVRSEMSPTRDQPSGEPPVPHGSHSGIRAA